MEAYEQTIVDQANAMPTREVCGVLKRDLSGLVAVPLPNISPDPENSFQMRPSDYLPYLQDKSLAGYYHSHPKTNELPSESDKKMAESAGFDCYIYSRVTGKFFKYTPTGYIVPLENRKFEFGVLDCWSLMEDYFTQTLKIEFKPIPRTPEMLDTGVKNIGSLMRERQFSMVVDSLKAHDIICMNVMNSTGLCNHVGVYLGERDLMLHQLRTRLSEKVRYIGYWKKHTLFIARHVSQL